MDRRCIAINTFLFDLDGTLLPLNQDEFVKAYFKGLAIKFAALGFNPETLIKAVWTGTEAMIRNTGEATNEKTFWKVFSSLIECDYVKIERDFTEFYNTDFDKVKVTAKTEELARKCIKLLKEKGYRLILSTNPIFPKIATMKRIAWAGLDPDDFELITTYENSRFCKPNLKYYESIMESLKLQPEECMVVGNDVSEDMCAAKLNMKTFLLTDCLINSKKAELSGMEQGSFRDLYEFIKGMPEVEKQKATGSPR